MSEPTKKPDDSLVVTLTLRELRQVIAEEIKGAMRDGSGEDRLVDATEAARLLDMSQPWLYANWKRLPFARKVGKALKFSHAGIQKYIRRGS